jgi:hypothetical protein
VLHLYFEFTLFPKDSREKAKKTMAKISPIAWAHILFTGKYNFKTSAKPLDITEITSEIEKIFLRICLEFNYRKNHCLVRIIYNKKITTFFEAISKKKLRNMELLLETPFYALQITMQYLISKNGKL